MLSDRFRKRITAVALMLLLFLPINVKAEEIKNQGDADLEYKACVPFSFSVSSVFNQYEYVYAYLFNEDTGKAYSVGTNFINTPDAYAYLDKGTYALGYIRLGEENITEMNYVMTPATFTVTEDKQVSADNIRINVSYQKKTADAVNTSLRINEGSFRGYASISYYNNTESVYRDKTDETIKYLYHTTVRKGNSSLPMYSGTVSISNINVYDNKKIPMNVYYKPSEQKAGEEIINMYAFYSEDELSEKQLAYLTDEKNGYILKSADEMCEFTDIEEGNTQLTIDGKALDKTFIVYVDDIPYPYNGCDISHLTPDKKERAPIYFKKSSKQSIDLRKGSFSYIPEILFIVTLLVIITVVFIGKKKRK